MILALFDRLRVAEAESFDHVHGLVEATKRAFRVRDRAITDPARLPQPLDRYLDAEFLDAEVAEDRPPQGRALASALWRRRHRLDGRRRRLGPRRVLHPVALLGVRLRRRAAAHRRADAEPRRELLARSAARSMRWRRAGCRSTRSIRRSPCCATAASWPTAPWAATASRRPRPRCSRATSRYRHAARSCDRRAALAARPDLGLDPYQPARGIPLRRQSRRSPALRRSRCRTCLPSPIRMSWAMPAPSCCIRTARWRAPTIRAPTAARPGYEIHRHATVRKTPDIRASIWPQSVISSGPHPH